MEIYKDTSICDLKDEVWRDVLGYEGMYECSNMGTYIHFFRVRRKRLWN